MSRVALPFQSDDISVLARSLNAQLAAQDHKPGHVELLNMLARSNGYRNFQHFRAQMTAHDQLDHPSPPPAPETVDHVRVRRLLRLFDTDGRLTRWPSKRSHQELCLWVMWSRLPPRQVSNEKEINRQLNANHLFGDHALLRRWLCDCGMMTRTNDGREYRRVERRPPADARALIHHLQQRSMAQGGGEAVGQ